ncbi:MAG TPA: DUF3313 domain-containing protein [Burkholderiales bacterium]|nr:DUF3313 domain-containing protein [Burkholderiales bacterium]
MTKQTLCMMVAIGVLWLHGCTTTAGDQSGFLARELDFRPAPDGSGALVYRKPGFKPGDGAKYTRFMIDPVLVWYSPQSDYKGIYPDELKAITDYFRTTAVGRLQDRYPVVAEPGADVVRIRAAIVDLHRENPLHLYQFTPVGIVLTGVKEASGLDAITRERVAAGNSYIVAATIEVGFYDSTTNELLGAYRDSTRASPSGREAGGASWGQVKATLDAWAQKLRARVDEAQAGR